METILSSTTIPEIFFSGEKIIFLLVVLTDNAFSAQFYGSYKSIFDNPINICSLLCFRPYMRT